MKPLPPANAYCVCVCVCGVILVPNKDLYSRVPNKDLYASSFFQGSQAPPPERKRQLSSCRKLHPGSDSSRVVRFCSGALGSFHRLHLSKQHWHQTCLPAMQTISIVAPSQLPTPNKETLSFPNQNQMAVRGHFESGPERDKAKPRNPLQAELRKVTHPLADMDGPSPPDATADRIPNCRARGKSASAPLARKEQKTGDCQLWAWQSIAS